MGFLTAAFSAIAKVFGFAQDRQALANTADMKANANASRDQAEADAASKEVANAQATGNLDQIRKDAAE